MLLKIVEGEGNAVLAVIHNRYFVFNMLHLLTVKKYPFTIPYIFRAK